MFLKFSLSKPSESTNVAQWQDSPVQELNLVKNYIIQVNLYIL